MKIQDFPKTAAETTVNLVKLPVELVTKVRELVEDRLGGGSGAEVSKPKPTANKPTMASATSSPTPTDTVPAAERAAVIDEQTDGLDDAVDRAQFELHKRDVS
jgi:hypothetical protein